MQLNRISDNDLQLINNKLVGYDFGYNNDIAELHIYSSSNILLKNNSNYNGYKPNPDYGLNGKYIQSLEINPELDIISEGFGDGIYKLVYNFFRKISNKEFFLKSISSDRTEIIVTSNSLDNIEIETIFTKLKSNFEDYNFIKNYLINFDNNDTFLITNIALDTNEDVYSIFLKLYSPLTKNISTKLLASFCEEIIQTNVVEVEIKTPEVVVPKPFLRSANFDLDFDSKSANSTEFLDTNAILSNVLPTDSIQSLLNKSSIILNIDYTNFEDFCHFGNVEQRILNFVYKIKQIESYTAKIGSNLGDSLLLNDKISKIISNFDGYEYFLYTSFDTKSYPKNINGTLKSTNSNDVVNWLGDTNGENLTGILGEAKSFDTFNKNSLINNIPEYLITDTRNKPFTIFCNMIGQHFDSIWISSKKFTDIYEANNNLYKGISPELVENVLKSFGVKLYNSMSNVDVKNIQHKSYNKEIYKRIYHNLPFLQKYKGTKNGLRQLINMFGIPDTLFRIYEYGSVKKGVNLGEHIDNVFNYCLTSNRNGLINIPYKNINSNDIPKSMLFRLKLNSKRVPTETVVGDFNVNDFNINDFYTTKSAANYSENIGYIKYDGNAYITIVSETFDNDISSVYLKHSDGNTSRRIYVNLYDGWLLFNINYTNNTEYSKSIYDLTIGQIINGKIYKNNTSLDINNDFSTTYSKEFIFTIGESLDFSIQKFLMTNVTLDGNIIDAHILNPNSIESGHNTFDDNILCYIPFGTDLKTYNHHNLTTLHSKFGSTVVSLSNFENKNNYVTNYDNISYNSPNTLSTKRVTNKITIPTKQYYGNVLSTFKQIETKNSEYVDYKFLDAVFSPTFEQDDDIINTLGYFNIDDYIGDPNDSQKNYYPNLKTLQLAYGAKLINKYSVKDYVNMINYIDNSLFKMIKDFVPISNNTSSGILVRQNILHRNKIKLVSTQFEQFFVNDIVLSKFNIEGLLQNIDKDFDINFKPNFDKLNYNKFLKYQNKPNKDEFRTSLFNQNITFLNNTFDYYSSIDLSNKYLGVRVSNAKLNEYVPNDISFDKTSNITSYVDKIGLFTNISNSEIFDRKSLIQLKYLVDKDGGLTDLNKMNKNFYDVQGIFVKNDMATISLFDNIKYSNQKTLDGNKSIYSSGFNYSPVLYFSNTDKYFKFDTTDETSSTYFRYFETTGRDISDMKYVYDIFNTKDVDVQNKYVVGNSSKSIFSTFEIPDYGQYEFNVDVLLKINSINVDLNFKYNLTTYRNYVSKDTIIDSVSYIHQPSKIEYGNYLDLVKFDAIKPVYKLLEIPNLGQISMTSFNNYWSIEKNSYNINGVYIPFDANRTWKIFERGIDKNQDKYRIYVSDDIDAYKTGYIYEIYDSNGNVEKLQDVYYDLYEETVSLTLPVKEYNYSMNNLVKLFIEQKGRGIIMKDYTSNGINNSYHKGEKILFVLEQEYTNDITPYTIMLQNSSSVYAIKNNFNLKLTSTESLITSIDNRSMTITSKLLDYMGNGVFNMSGSTLYEKYGDVNEIFNIDIGDIICINDIKTTTKYFIEISDKQVIGSNIILSFLNEIPTFVLLENISECVFINKIRDESNIVINFAKKKGETSYGFIIPKNINPYFMQNIDKITKEVKLKLLNDYSLNKNSI